MGPNAVGFVYASLDKRIRAQTIMSVEYVVTSDTKQVKTSGAPIAFNAMETPGTWKMFSVYADYDSTLKGTYTESLKVTFASEIDAASCAGTPSLCGNGSAALAVEVGHLSAHKLMTRSTSSHTITVATEES